MEKKETKVTPVKVTSAKPAAAVKEEPVVKAAAKEAVVEKAAKTEVKKVEEPKKEAVKKAEEPKKEAEKKAPAKKAAKKAPAKKKEVEKIEEVYVQFHELEISTKDILAKAKQAYVAEGHRESSIKSIRLYIKPEERMAYYVINDKFAGGVAL